MSTGISKPLMNKEQLLEHADQLQRILDALYSTGEVDVDQIEAAREYITSFIPLPTLADMTQGERQLQRGRLCLVDGIVGGDLLFVGYMSPGNPVVTNIATGDVYVTVEEKHVTPTKDGRRAWGPTGELITIPAPETSDAAADEVECEVVDDRPLVIDSPEALKNLPNGSVVEGIVDSRTVTASKHTKNHWFIGGIDGPVIADDVWTWFSAKITVVREGK